jgi:hypothetical protein
MPRYGHFAVCFDCKVQNNNQAFRTVRARVGNPSNFYPHISVIALQLYESLYGHRAGNYLVSIPHSLAPMPYAISENLCYCVDCSVMFNIDPTYTEFESCLKNYVCVISFTTYFTPYFV